MKRESQCTYKSELFCLYGGLCILFFQVFHDAICLRNNEVPVIYAKQDPENFIILHTYLTYKMQITQHYEKKISTSNAYKIVERELMNEQSTLVGSFFVA